MWLETGAVARPAGADAGESYTLDRSVALTLPSSIVSAVRQRLTRLSSEVVDVLGSAAIIGRTFDVMVLAEVIAQEPEDVEEHLQNAARAGLIRPGAAGTFTFSHDKTRECLYEDLTSVRRRRLHGLIGRALEVSSEPPSGQRLAELAFHFARSVDRARGAMYAQRAAEHAMGAYAAEEAMAHYRATLGLIDAKDARRGEVLLGLGEAAMLAGSEREAVGALEAARAWFHEAGDEVGAARAAHRLGRAWWRQEAIDQAKAAFESALALLADHAGPEPISVLVDLGDLLASSLHQPSAGIAHSRRALELAQQLADHHLLAR